MTPTRFREILALLHWSQRGVAAPLQCSEGLTRAWARGTYAIPEPVAEWLETLAAAHAAAPPPVGWQSRGPRAASGCAAEAEPAS